MPVGLSNDPLWKQITAVWRLKLSIAVVLPVVFCVPYFLIERFPIFPAHTLRQSWLDRVVPFRPVWTIVYLSFHLVVYLVPWLGRSREDMRRFGYGFLLLTFISFVCFMLFPVMGPRPVIVGDSWMYRTVVSYDSPLNSFPSLHAGLLVYTIAFGWRVTRNWVPSCAIIAMVIWVGLIFYSTMAVKEHYAVDLLTGGLLGIVCDATAWRLEIKAMPLPEKS